MGVGGGSGGGVAGLVVRAGGGLVDVTEAVGYVLWRLVGRSIRLDCTVVGDPKGLKESIVPLVVRLRKWRLQWECNSHEE